MKKRIRLHDDNSKTNIRQDQPRVGLHDPEPWGTKVNGAKLLNNMARAFRRHVALEKGYPELLVVWAMHCHCYEAFQITPRLRITSPVPECGKTLVLEVLARLTPRSQRTEHITSAAMFRFIDKYRPILLVDEADTFLRKNGDLRGIIDSGHRKDGSFVRAKKVGGEYEPYPSKTFAPMALAGLGELHSAIVSRSLTVKMQRLPVDVEITELTLAHYPCLESLNRKAARWAADHFKALVNANPDMPQGVINRHRDNWKPLLAIADAAGSQWPETARTIALRLTAKAGEDADPKIMLLEDIRKIFTKTGKEALSSKALCDHLATMEDCPWGEWQYGKPMTMRQLAAQLRPFGVSPGTVRFKATTFKGYRKKQFEESWERYPLPSFPED